LQLAWMPRFHLDDHGGTRPQGAVDRAAQVGGLMGFHSPTDDPDPLPPLRCPNADSAPKARGLSQTGTFRAGDRVRRPAAAGVRA
jgi:hypothetical protein